jgi:fructose-1,6-bisphosphatase
MTEQHRENAHLPRNGGDARELLKQKEQYEQQQAYVDYLLKRVDEYHRLQARLPRVVCEIIQQLDEDELDAIRRGDTHVSDLDLPGGTA